MDIPMSMIERVTCIVRTSNNIQRDLVFHHACIMASMCDHFIVQSEATRINSSQ